MKRRDERVDSGRAAEAVIRFLAGEIERDELEYALDELTAQRPLRLVASNGRPTAPPTDQQTALFDRGRRGRR